MIPEKINLKTTHLTAGRDKFPRPDRIRNPAYSLCGEWMLCPDKKGEGLRKKWYMKDVAQSIINRDYGKLPVASSPFAVHVPFPLESEINQKILSPHGLNPRGIAKIKRFWYFLSFDRPGDIEKGLLHFGAVDYRATVWLNGIKLGQHEGGYTPFSFPAEQLQDHNVLAVMVEDSPSGSQVRGKQTFLKKPFMVWYTGITGIWQPVWIEKITSHYISDVIFTRGPERMITFNAGVVGSGDLIVHDLSLEVQVFASQVHGKKGALKTPIKIFKEAVTFDPFNRGECSTELQTKLFDQWTPGWPALHPVQVILKRGNREVDRLYLYFGHRQVEVENGIIQLNGKQLYQRLLLHQGYYLEGLYRPENDQQYHEDITIMKNAGFNGCRMHQKIEDPRFHYWADIMGFLVWEEMPSYYYPSTKNMRKMEHQLHEVLRRDSMHPSVITNVLFNESWGIYSTFVSGRARKNVIDLFNRVRQQYPGYLYIDNSGFHHLKTDIMDIHHYIPDFSDVEDFYRLLEKGVREAPLWGNFFSMLLGRENVQTPCLKGYGDKEAPLFISEMGGFGFDMYKSQVDDLETFFKNHLEILSRFRNIQGFCYTQFADTFQEKNGLFTENRQCKLKDPSRIMRNSLPGKIFW